MGDFSILVRTLVLLSALVAVGAEEGRTIVENGSSDWVRLTPSGELAYHEDEKGNRLPDFSWVGYHAGERAIPRVPVRRTLTPSGGDDTRAIQDALDEIGRLTVGEEGLRGALLLKSGTYRVDGQIRIRHSGLVLCGEGSGEDGTVLVAAGHGEPADKRALIVVGERDGQAVRLDQESRREITDSFVPIGARQFRVSSAKGYAVGDKIVVYRPGTGEWIHHIGCDEIPSRWGKVWDTYWKRSGDGRGFYYRRAGISGHQRISLRAGESWEQFQQRIRRRLDDDGNRLDFTRQWRPGSYDMHFERRIVAVDGDRVSIDAPLVHGLDQRFGGGAIFHYSSPGRVREVGVESLRLISEFGPASEGHPYGAPDQRRSAELHGWHGVVLECNTRDTWVRDVAGNYFGWSLVSARGVGATVTDCVSFGHASRIAGGRRYPFMTDGQLNLFQRCAAVSGRHEFVVQARTWGPNVFVDCLGVDSKSSAGPHHRYGVGTLYDNVSSEHYMESRWRGNSGTGHGWAGAQTVFYNCTAPKFHVQAPPGGMCWVIGSGPADSSERKPVRPASLYYQQLKERLGSEAVYRLTEPEFLRTLGAYHWAPGSLRPD
ncbi:MAG: hypothetical protein R6X33_13755 [Candidatus Brocadiia bacterium]